MKLFKINLAYIIDGNPDLDPDDCECAEECMVLPCIDREEAIRTGRGLEAEWNCGMICSYPAYERFKDMQYKDNKPKSLKKLRVATWYCRGKYYQFEEDVTDLDMVFYSNDTAGIEAHYMIVLEDVGGKE